jgi:hypothetical protein
VLPLPLVKKPIVAAVLKDGTTPSEIIQAAGVIEQADATGIELLHAAFSLYFSLFVPKTPR